jgi:hypothetical protein
MTTNQMQLAREGVDLWREYVRVNGYAFRPNAEGLHKLARLLDLRQNWIAKRITAYLEA